MTAAYFLDMNFFIPEHFTTGVLNGDDLRFFYYDVGLENFQGWPEIYEWNAVIEEFRGSLDIGSCVPDQMPLDYIQNHIRFTLLGQKESRMESEATAFFRHLRNAFAHYRIVRDGDNYILTDEAKHTTTMLGMVNAELLKSFCFRLFEIRDKTVSEYEKTHNQDIENI